MNIILILTDTVRKDFLSPYGNRGFGTPCIEKFAEESVLYNNVISPAPWTTPVHASLFTGMVPSQHGTHGGNLNFEVPQGRSSLMRSLGQQGYRCTGISTNYLISEQFGFSKDFDRFHQVWQIAPQPYCDYHFGLESFQKATKLRKFSTLAQELVAWKNGWNPAKSALNHWYAGKMDIIEDATLSTRRAFKLANKAILARNDTPFFLFINLMQAHEKYNPPPQIRDELGIGPKLTDIDAWQYYGGRQQISEEAYSLLARLYAGEVSYLDRCLGEFFDFLRSLPLWDESMVVIVSDHGELLGEHGQLGHLIGLFGELINVPMIIKYPSGILKPGDDGNLRQSHDLYATILELAGLKTCEDTDSLSLLEGDGREEAVSQLVSCRFIQDGIKRHGGNLKEELKKYAIPMMAIIKDNFKYIKADSGKDWLFNLSKDPFEQLNLAQDPRMQPAAEKLSAKMESAAERTGFYLARNDSFFDSAVKERLKAMGYI